MLETWKVFGDYLVVKPEEAKEVSDGGVLLLEQGQKKSFVGRVALTGSGLYNTKTESYLPLQTKVGDRVMYHKFSAKELTLDGEEYVLIEESDVIGYLDEEVDMSPQFKVGLK